MRKLNLLTGAILLGIFLATGLYMKFVFRPEHLADTTARMEIRANHIYILFIALLNLLSFPFQTPSTTTLRKWSIGISRTMFVLAGILAVVAFFREHSGVLQGRIFTFSSVLLSLSAVLLMLFANHFSSKLKDGTGRDIS
ncbi:hypothetical protein [Leptospira kirschneri]|uniref:hypothetical protein n=1 Tax=Leptospira kirschneri TaxID=29507 RepID=UPI00356521BA